MKIQKELNFGIFKMNGPSSHCDFIYLKGQTPLHICADEDNIEMIKFLLNLGKKYPNSYVSVILLFEQ